MKIVDLEYLSLEGGGGKGAVYLGAIEAIQNELAKEFAKRELKCILNSKIEYATDLQVEIFKENKDIDFFESSNPKAILDYYNKDDKLKIKGIAGASAGAITAFPLSLGLSSLDIDIILNGYPFDSEFLPNNKLNEGKYRMVGCAKNGVSKILIAEDKGKKLGENNIKPFLFDFVKTEIDGTPKTKEGSNTIKSFFRNKIVDFFIKTILSGFTELIPSLSNYIRQVRDKYKLTNSLKNDTDLQQKVIKSSIGKNTINVTWLNLIDTFTNFLLAFPQKEIFKGGKVLSNSILKSVLNLILRFFPSKILGLIPRDNITSAISNIIWDRGIYAGFETREFFFKIIIMALSKDTHFRRKFIENKNYEEVGLISADKILLLEGAIDDNFNINPEISKTNSDTIIKLSRKLPEWLTFEKLFEITNINLSFCVTNGTTSQPLYFSNYFTPNYPVIEAVTSSMNFPVAFKPTYNEANVIENNLYEDLPKAFITKSNGIINKEHFSILDYNKYLNILLEFINERCQIKFSLNGNLSFRSYLPFIRAVIANDDFYNTITNPRTLKKEEVRNNTMRALALFYYNAAFKGLHMDGGITNNLPIAIHTLNKEKGNKIGYDELQNHSLRKNVLSLKLDSSFPQNFKEEIANTIEKKLLPYNKSIADIDDVYGFSPLNSLLQLSTKKIIKKAFKSSNATDKVIYKKVIEELKSDYKKGKKGFTPWNKQVFIISAVAGGLQFGMGQGQENIEDNANIIPLYCFGLSVLEFNLTSDEVEPLVKISNIESKKAVETYFKPSE